MEEESYEYALRQFVFESQKARRCVDASVAHVLARKLQIAESGERADKQLRKSSKERETEDALDADTL